MITRKVLKQNDYYRTSSLALATAISLWYPIEKIDRTNPRKVQFIFKRTNKLDEIIDAYWRRELKVEPQAYFDQLRIIKVRISNGF